MFGATATAVKVSAVKKVICCCLVACFFLPCTTQAQQGPKVTGSKPQDPPAKILGASELIVSVRNYADVPAPALAAAEARATNAFRHAGLDTLWVNCAPRVEGVDSMPCNAPNRTHLMLTILPRAMRAHQDRNDVLGTALLDEDGIGYHAYVYYDRLQQLAHNRELGNELLGVVFAHEIGHLLLGSNAHSLNGIMCAHWKYKEFLAVSEGIIAFLPEQSRIMRDRWNALQDGASDMVAKADYRPDSTRATF
jgi:hypothetical protein